MRMLCLCTNLKCNKFKHVTDVDVDVSADRYPAADRCELVCYSYAKIDQIYYNCICSILIESYSVSTRSSRIDFSDVVGELCALPAD